MAECDSTGFAAKLSQVYTWLSSLMGSYDKLIEVNDNTDEIIAAADAAELSVWESAASKMTADSYANEAQGVHVKLYTSNGDGTFTSTDTNEYSALHWASVAETLAIGNLIDDVTPSAMTVYSSEKVEASFLPFTLKGAANGVAGLDSTGKVPAVQLPSYVDDVLEYAGLASLPVTGESGKIYVALDTNKTYRWSGSAYVEISASSGLFNIVEDETPSLGGELNGQGNAMVDVWYKQLPDVTVSSGTHTIYFQQGNRQKITAGVSFALAFGGISANQNVFVIEAVNWGAYTITFPASLKVDNGELPAFSASGTDLVVIEVDKNGTYTLAVIAVNIGVVAV